jgi:hypothetical protein
MSRYSIALGKLLPSENSEEVEKKPIWYGVARNNEGNLVVSDGTNTYEQVRAHYERIDNG